MVCTFGLEDTYLDGEPAGAPPDYSAPATPRTPVGCTSTVAGRVPSNAERSRSRMEKAQAKTTRFKPAATYVVRSRPYRPINKYTETSAPQAAPKG